MRGIEPKGDWLLAPGPSYKDQLAELIRESDVFIATISQLSVTSPECRDEIDQANLQKKKLLPVQIQDGFDKAALHEALRLPQWTLLRPFDDFAMGFKALVEAINTDFELMIVHTWLTQRANDWGTRAYPRSALLSGRDLKQAEMWLPNVSASQLELPNVTPLQTKFILASQNARTRRAQRLVGLTALIMIALSALSGYAFYQRRIARRNEQAAVKNAHRELIARQDADKNAAEAKRQAGIAKESEASALEQEFLAKKTLSNSDFLQAQRMIEEDKASEAMAFLARAVRMNPDNIAAKSRITSLLLYRSWPWPVTAALKHEWAVNFARFSPNGRTLLTAAGNTARLWNVDTGQPIGTPMKHGRTIDERADYYKNYINDIRFSPDGARIVTASSDGTARLWDAKTGEPIGDLMDHGDGAEVKSAEFSPDGETVVTACTNGLRVWDAVTGEGVSDLIPSQGALHSASFSPDSKRILIVTQGQDGPGKAQILGVRKGKLMIVPLEQSEAVLNAEFSPDGKNVVACGGQGRGDVASFFASAKNTTSGSVVIFDARTGKELRKIKQGDVVYAAHFNSRGDRLLSVCADDTVRVWDAVTTEQVGPPMRHEGVSSALFSPDGNRIVTIGGNYSVARIWDAATGKQVCEPLKHQNEIRDASFSPDMKRLATASADGTACVWDLQSRVALIDVISTRFDAQPGAAIPDAQFNQHADHLLTDAGDLYDTLHDQAIRNDIHPHFAQFSSDGKRIVSIGVHSVRVFDAETWKPLDYTIDDQITWVAFSPDGKRLITAGGDTAKIWDAETGRELGSPMKHEEEEEDQVQFAEFSGSGKYIVTATAQMAHVWDLASGKLLSETKELHHPNDSSIYMNSVHFSPDERRILTACGFKAQMWDVETGEPVGKPMQHDFIVRSARFNEDGSRVVTASWDGCACIWDAHTGEMVKEPFLHGIEVSDARFSPEGRRIATASGIMFNKYGIPLVERRFDIPAERFTEHAVSIFDTGTGQLISESMTNRTRASFVIFSPDGNRIAANTNGGVALFDVPAFARLNKAGEIAALSELAELAGGIELDSRGLPRRFHVEELLERRCKLSKAANVPDTEASQPLNRFLHWFFADPATRTISPFSEISTAEWINRRLASNDLEQAKQALAFNPQERKLTARVAELELAKRDESLGYEFADNKNWSAAEKAFSDVIRLNAADAGVWYGRGEARLQLGQADAALSDLNKVIEIDENDVAARDMRAKIRVQRGDWRGAIEDYNVLINSNNSGNLGVLLVARGSAYRRIGDIDKALADFTQAVARKDESCIDPLKVEIAALKETGINRPEIGRIENFLNSRTNASIIPSQ